MAQELQSQTGALALAMENPTTYVKVIKLDEIFCDLVRSYEQSIDAHWFLLRELK